MEEIAKRSKAAALELSVTTTIDKNKLLGRIKDLLKENQVQIFQANKEDLRNAQELCDQGKLSKALIKRLNVKGDDSCDKFNSLLDGITDVIDLADPIGEVTFAKKLDKDASLYRVVCPVGVLLVIFEARPEVVVQIACLCIKSGNSVILKGGKEATNTNTMLVKILKEAIVSAGVCSPDLVQYVSDRNDVNTLLKMDSWIDLVIPRGSKELVSFVKSNTTIPVLGHADGICSVYVDEFSDFDMASKVVIDSKTNYVAACNSAETLLIHERFSFIKEIIDKLIENRILVKLPLQLIEKYAFDSPLVSEASASDYDTEFLDYTIAVKIVGSVKDAISHINQHGSHHTDAIITSNRVNAELFMNSVDSAGVFWNASTRFADGFRYGFGAEIGVNKVSTSKTHARGPVGLSGLTIYKYRLYGNGHCVSDFGPKGKKYDHSDIPLTLPE